MQFPESWLREFCDPPLSTEQLAELLTMSGMEVEALGRAAPPFAGVVVGEIVECEPHPNADRLRVCRVAAGEHSSAALLQVVCGAPNARVGLKAPLALPGAQLPPGDDGRPFEIKVGVLRGVESRGMLCSSRELKLSDEHAGLLELPADAPVGVDIRRFLDLDDALFTLKLTPNLGHCLSVYGIAREVSALTGAPLKTPAIEPVAATHAESLPVRIEAPDLCGRFSGRIVKGVDPAARTPRWMVDRLARCGQRSVNALVDISNYVMFEYGRPSHIFDRDRIHEHLVVRWARPGESLKLLNGETVELDGAVGVIADSQAVESLAGIMGGDATAVSDATRNVYVEAAFWWPESVAGRSRRYAFSTDAGHRFERGVDPSTTVEHIERITGLIQSICGGEAGPMDDQQVRLPQFAPVPMRVARAEKVIGMPVTHAQCAGVFHRLGLQFTEEPGRLVVSVPSWRFDLQIEEDLIEEVVRVTGYDKLPSRPPEAPVTGRLRAESRRSVHALRHLMAALDYQETISFSFVEERWERELAGNADPIRVLNPIAAPLSVMRSSLIGCLVDALKHNIDRRATRVRLFELGRVFRRDATVTDGALTVAGVDQPMRLGGIAYGAVESMQWGQAERAVDFFDVKGDLESLFGSGALQCTAGEHPSMHPGRCARLVVRGRDVGVVGELHPRWRQVYELPLAPVLFEVDLEAVLQIGTPAFEPLSRFPASYRDLALVVPDSTSHEDLMDALRADPQELVQQAVLFDIYRPDVGAPGFAPGERSMAVRLELQDPNATLTDERIDGAVAAAVSRAQAAVGARLRGNFA